MLTKNGRIVGMALTVISASCSGVPDLCKDSPPTCINNVARYCSTIKDCDSCSYHAQIIPQDCTKSSATDGVAKTCEIGSGKMSGAALCVDASMTKCSLDYVVLCDARGYSSDCVETVDGPLLRSGAIGCVGGSQQDAAARSDGSSGG